LIVGAQKVLERAGQAGDAGKVKTLFSTRRPADDNTIGTEFELNLSQVRVPEAENLSGRQVPNG
jgi:hypothetical protein